MIGKLGTSGGLTRALKTNEHNYIRLALLELIGHIFTLKHRCQLLNDSLLDEFTDVNTITLTRVNMQ
jgi:hypothetical protein